jgi:alpha-glucosidase
MASDLDGLGWHGAMNYQGFMRPAWNWLNRNSEIGGGFQGLPFSMPKIDGVQLVNSMKQFSASIPWRSLTASMVLLDSHDTARFRTVVKGDLNAHLSGMALALTYPGVPSIFAGDEIGLEGTSGEDSRRTINWEDQSAWDVEFLAKVKKLIHIRRTHDALSNGGLRWIAVEKEYLLFMRESKKESLLIFISRGEVSCTIDLKKLGIKSAKSLFGPELSVTNLKISSSSALQAIWEVK